MLRPCKHGKTNIIYVKNFIYTNSSDKDLPENNIKSEENTEVPESNFLKYENHTSGNIKIKLLEVPKSYSNNTEYSNTKYNDTDSTIVSYQENKDSVSSDAIGWMRERNIYRQIIKGNVEYDIMVEQFEKSWLDEIIELMVDVVCSKDIKILAVQEYLTGKYSLRDICKKYKISSNSILRSWIKVYNDSHKELKTTGSGGRKPMTKARKTTFEERIEIVQFCIANGKNYGLTMDKFNISYQQIYLWVHKTCSFLHTRL